MVETLARRVLSGGDIYARGEVVDGSLGHLSEGSDLATSSQLGPIGPHRRGIRGVRTYRVTA